MFLKIHYAISTGLFSGLLRPASGTWGSAAAILFWYLIWLPFPNSSINSDLTLILLISALGTYSTAKVLAGIERGSLPAPKKPKDPSFVVIDEWAGMWITLLGTSRTDFFNIAICFLLFRALDVLKPYPIRALEKLPGAWGIMLDDIAAGIVALALKLILEPQFQILYSNLH